MVDQEKVWDDIAGCLKEFRNEVSPTVLKFLDGKKGKILDSSLGLTP